MNMVEVRIRILKYSDAECSLINGPKNYVRLSWLFEIENQTERI